MVPESTRQHRAGDSHTWPVTCLCVDSEPRKAFTYLEDSEEIKTRRVFHDTGKFCEVQVSMSINKVFLERTWAHLLM